jgi:hypothetical protein
LIGRARVWGKQRVEQGCVYIFDHPFFSLDQSLCIFPSIRARQGAARINAATSPDEQRGTQRRRWGSRCSGTKTGLSMGARRVTREFRSFGLGLLGCRMSLIDPLRTLDQAPPHRQLLGCSGHSSLRVGRQVIGHNCRSRIAGEGRAALRFGCPLSIMLWAVSTRTDLPVLCERSGVMSKAGD